MPSPYFVISIVYLGISARCRHRQQFGPSRGARHASASRHGGPAAQSRMPWPVVHASAAAAAGWQGGSRQHLSTGKCGFAFFQKCCGAFLYIGCIKQLAKGSYLGRQARGGLIGGGIYKVQYGLYSQRCLAVNGLQ